MTQPPGAPPRPRAWHRPLAALALLVALAPAFASCTARPAEDDPASRNDDTHRYLAAWGPYRLTAGDFRDALRVRAATHALRIPTLRARLIDADDDTLRDVIRVALEHGYALHESRHTSLPDDDAALRRAIIDDMPGAIALLDPALEAARDDTLRALELTEEDADTFTARLLRMAAWPAISHAELEDEALQAAWIHARTGLHIAVASIPNRPRPADVDEVLRTRRAEIRAWYDQHAEHRLTEPLRVRVHALRLALDGAAPEDHARALQRMQDLRERLDAGPFLDHDEILAAIEAGELLHAEFDWREPQHIPGLRPMEVGETSEPIPLPDAVVIYHLADRRDAHVRPLDRAVERQIASTLLREAGPVPEAAAVANALLSSRPDSLEAFREAAEGLELRVDDPPSFRVGDTRFIPIVGRAPELAHTLLDHDTPSSAIVDLVHHTATRLFVVFLIERSPPDLEGFAAERDAFAQQHARTLRDSARERRLEDLRARFEPIIDLEAVRQTLQRDHRRAEQQPTPPREASP